MDAVMGSLQWLARHQNPDGSWSVTGYTARCRESCSPNPGSTDFNTGVTGLALLAFLGAGYSHLSKDSYDDLCFGDTVRKGLQWVMKNQDAEGFVGPRGVEKGLYNHAIAALALGEAWGMTGSSFFKDPAQHAIDFLLVAQNPGRGWRYEARPGDNDTSVTGWAVMALKSGEISGLALPRSGYEGARAWLDAATDEAGRTGYTARGTGKVFIPGANEAFDDHETTTAIALMSRIFMDRKKDDPRHRPAAETLVRDLPRWGAASTDFYYWYCASLALFQLDGPSGPIWRTWNEPLRNTLVRNQNPKSAGCRAGSWEPVDRWSSEGGRVYATAINALTLEVYYRYSTCFGSQ